MPIEVTYYYRIHCPWCKTLEQVLLSLELVGLIRVRKVCVDGLVTSGKLSTNKLFAKWSMGEVKPIAPLIIVHEGREKIIMYIRVAEKDAEEEVTDEVVKTDVAKLTLDLLRYLYYRTGISVDHVLEKCPIVLDLLEYYVKRERRS